MTQLFSLLYLATGLSTARHPLDFCSSTRRFRDDKPGVRSLDRSMTSRHRQTIATRFNGSSDFDGDASAWTRLKTDLFQSGNLGYLAAGPLKSLERNRRIHPTDILIWNNKKIN